MPPKRIEHLPVVPTPDDDSSPSGRPLRRETRGTHSDRLRRQIEERGRLPITFRKSDGHPIGPNAAAFMTELGVSIKKFAPLQIKSWKHIPADRKNMIYDRLSAAFDISFEEGPSSVRKETDRLMSARYRDNRSKMHTHYKKLLHLPPIERRQHMPTEFCEIEADWHYMCDLFESEAFQARSAKNVENRAKLPFNHRGGSKSFIQYSYDGIDQSQRKDRITVFNETHYSTSKGMIWSDCVMNMFRHKNLQEMTSMQYKLQIQFVIESSVHARAILEDLAVGQSQLGPLLQMPPPHLEPLIQHCVKGSKALKQS
ncbi:uncharacterized protein LOC141817226 [Curcuma longa]|uniref:uncharacterized protein LOC141817226 n=1 Tax=Curcuma longa TaxID=136217 RepID=UPI003D9E2FA5